MDECLPEQRAGRNRQREQALHLAHRRTVHLRARDLSTQHALSWPVTAILQRVRKVPLEEVQGGVTRRRLLAARFPDSPATATVSDNGLEGSGVIRTFAVILVGEWVAASEANIKLGPGIRERLGTGFRDEPVQQSFSNAFCACQTQQADQLTEHRRHYVRGQQPSLEAGARPARAHQPSLFYRPPRQLRENLPHLLGQLTCG
nr:hypothetical protein KPHV_22580 [Kitasatospora purpeofusca]